MDVLIISQLEAADETIEIVERKGLGHPDTICDALAENLSRTLCREYRSRFGEILHHNVDKALLRGGRAMAEFGGGSVLVPIEIYLAGRAISEVGKVALPVSEIAIEGSRAWLRANLHALDAEHHVRIHNLVRPGAHDLRTLFSRPARDESPLANDKSIGVGYAPLSPLEQLVLAVERGINGRDRANEHRAWGEDVKVMGVRNRSMVHLTVACAIVGQHVAHLDDYLGEKASLERLARELAAQHGFTTAEIAINAADHLPTGAVYLTVTGTSAEAGDDGEVGRGNRVNGLITPYRPMSLEAAAGKNPVTHVGKIYNVLARQIAGALIRIPDIAAAQCVMVNRIGASVTRPALVQLKLGTRDGVPAGQLKPQVEEVVVDQLSRAPKLVDDFVAGTAAVF
jgi:S-adenosylmethionine synthetase